MISKFGGLESASYPNMERCENHPINKLSSVKIQKPPLKPKQLTLTMVHLGNMFVLLFYGYCLSIIAFFCEIIAFGMKFRRTRKRTFTCLPQTKF